MHWILTAAVAIGALWLLVQGLIWLGEHPFWLVSGAGVALLLCLLAQTLRPAPSRPTALRQVPPRHDGKPIGMILDQKD